MKPYNILLADKQKVSSMIEKLTSKLQRAELLSITATPETDQGPEAIAVRLICIGVCAFLRCWKQ